MTIFVRKDQAQGRIEIAADRFTPSRDEALYNVSALLLRRDTVLKTLFADATVGWLLLVLVERVKEVFVQVGKEKSLAVVPGTLGEAKRASIESVMAETVTLTGRLSPASACRHTAAHLRVERLHLAVEMPLCYSFMIGLRNVAKRRKISKQIRTVKMIK